MIEITPEIKKTMTSEVDKLEEVVQDYLGQRISDGKFQRFRLQHGIYGQRQEGVQMIRIKVPFGELSAEQFERVADVCEKYSGGITHVTTRQDVQIYYVKLIHVPEALRQLAEVGVTTREACGNTVRNVTACPYSGVSQTEPFDVIPYAHAFAYHMLRNPICQNMGRKFKVAFEGCDEDHARLGIHDIGFWATIKNGRRGFRVYTAGGLGSHPRVADLFYDFLPEDELIPFGESIIRVFDRYGERAVRSMARMKFLAEKLGFKELKRLVEEERKVLHVDPSWNDYLKTIDEAWATPSHKACQEGVDPPEAETADYLAWKTSNVLPQRQEGFSSVQLRLPLGDMVPSQMRSLAQLSQKYGNGMLRVSIEQNIFLNWIHDEDLPALHRELKKIDMAAADADTIYDILACPGTDTCRLGIAASKSLATVLGERLKAENGSVSQLAQDLHIKISGCPNSCGQHHLGNIGFHGAALPQEEHVVPAFQLHLGGNADGDKTSIGKIVMKIPSKNVPDATVRLIRYYSENRSGEEDFNSFYERFGRKATEDLLRDLEQVAEYEEKPDFYTDWGDQKEFALQKGVIGECAGSPVTDGTPSLDDAQAPLEQARAFLAHGEYPSSLTKAYEAIGKAADVLLYNKKIQTFETIESVQEFENHFIRTGEFPELNGFRPKIEKLLQGEAKEDTAKAMLEVAETVATLCKKRRET